MIEMRELQSTASLVTGGGGLTAVYLVATINAGSLISGWCVAGCSQAMLAYRLLLGREVGTPSPSIILMGVGFLRRAEAD